MSSDDDGDYGELERTGGRAEVRFTRRLRHPPEKVWRALTEPEHLAAWFPTTIDGERKAGASLRFGFPESEGEPFEGRMLVFDPPRLMELQWGDETLRMEVQPHGEGSRLLFSASFEELGKAARDGAGWHASLDLLGFEIEDAQAPWSAPERWREVRHSYIERFGPEASTIGPPEEWERVHGSETGPV